jgi:hypothetical protein
MAAKDARRESFIVMSSHTSTKARALGAANIHLLLPMAKAAASPRRVILSAGFNWIAGVRPSGFEVMTWAVVKSQVAGHEKPLTAAAGIPTLAC